MSLVDQISALASRVAGDVRSLASRVVPQNLPTAAGTHDLNSYTSPGVFYQSSATGATNLNYPPLVGVGVLTVEPVANGVYQEVYQTYVTTRRVYLRARLPGPGGVWTAWVSTLMGDDASVALAGNKLVRRSPGGNISTSTPVDANDAATKAYVDGRSAPQALPTTAHNLNDYVTTGVFYRDGGTAGSLNYPLDVGGLLGVVATAGGAVHQEYQTTSGGSEDLFNGNVSGNMFFRRVRGSGGDWSAWKPVIEPMEMSHLTSWLTGRKAGVVGADSFPLQVSSPTAASPSLTFTNRGMAMVELGMGRGQGMISVSLVGSVPSSVARPASGARIVRVGLRWEASGRWWIGGLRGEIVYLVGDSHATAPVAPTLPENTIPLWSLFVPAGTAPVILTDERVFLGVGGAPVAVPNEAALSRVATSTTEATLAFQRDSGKLWSHTPAGGWVGAGGPSTGTVVPVWHSGTAWPARPVTRPGDVVMWLGNPGGTAPPEMATVDVWSQNDNTLQGQWQTSAVVFEMGSPPSLGTGGSATGRFTRIGNTVHYLFRIVYGTGATAGTGAYRISLPYPYLDVLGGTTIQIGTVAMLDSSASHRIMAAVVPDTTRTSVNFRTYPAGTPGTAGTASNSTPWTWGAGDVIEGSCTYEAVPL